MTPIEDIYYFRIKTIDPMRVPVVCLYVRRTKPRFWQREYIEVRTTLFMGDGLEDARWALKEYKQWLVECAARDREMAKYKDYTPIR